SSQEGGCGLMQAIEPKPAPRDRGPGPARCQSTVSPTGQNGTSAAMPSDAHLRTLPEQLPVTLPDRFDFLLDELVHLLRCSSDEVTRIQHSLEIDLGK